jgi:divalent metal cation (Fe/Co/Zn/Cd) transporter
LIGVALGFHSADGVAGLVITVFIAHVGWEVTSELLVHLMDGVDPDVITTAESAVLGVAGIDHAYARARWMGRSLLVEVEGFVAAGSTVYSVEALGRTVEAAVIAAVPERRAVLWTPRSLP